MKNLTIASTLVTLSLGAFVSACGGAEMTASSDQPGLESIDPVVDETEEALTVCDDLQYDHWRHLAELAVAAGTELGRWNATVDFQSNNYTVSLSPTGLARCKNGCEAIQALLSLQTNGDGVIPRHQAGLLRTKMIAYFERQRSWDSNNGGPIPHTFGATRVEPANCGHRFWFVDTVPMFTGTTPIKSAHSGKCIDTTGMNDGSNLVQMSCDGASDQSIVVEPIATGGYRLKNTASQKCVRVPGSNAGSMLEQRTCDSSNNQLFDITDFGTNNGKIAFKNRFSGMCAEISSWSTSDGAKLSQSACSQWNAPQLFTATLSTVQLKNPKQSKMQEMVNFVGGSENPYIQFMSNETEVSIDPMGTILNGQVTLKSGDCFVGSSLTDTTKTSQGVCCEYNDKYGTLQQTSWNKSLYYCK